MTQNNIKTISDLMIKAQNQQLIENYAQAFNKFTQNQETENKNECEKILRILNDSKINEKINDFLNKIALFPHINPFQICNLLTKNKNILALFKILINNNELYLLKFVLEQITHLDEQIIAQLITPSPHDNISKIQKQLSKNTNKNVQIENIIDPSLIKGFILRIKGNEIDTSYKSKLSQLEQHLKRKILI